MIDFIKSLTGGQYKILFWFLLAIVFIYIPGMIIWFRRKKRKASRYEHDHPEAVKVYIKSMKANDILTVYSVNGKPPVMFTEGLLRGFYVLPGVNKMGIQYQWFEKNGFSLLGYDTHTIDAKEKRITIKLNKSYLLSYNHEKSKYIFTEVE